MSATTSSSSASSQPDVRSTEKWAVTTVKLRKFNYTWTINNFSFCREEIGQKLFSPTFKDNDEVPNEWRLSVYPKGENEEKKNDFGIYLNLVSSDKTEIPVRFNFFIVNEQNENKSYKSSKTLNKFKLKGNASWGYGAYIKRDFLLDKENKLLPKDKLTILSEISIVGKVVGIAGENMPIQANLTKIQLSDDMERLLESKKFCDLKIADNSQKVITIRGKEIEAHRAILGARSEIFAKMMENEVKNGILTLKGEISNEVLEELLNFIYVGKVKNMAKNAKDLLVEANRYDLQRLKTMCEISLGKSLCIANAVDTVLFAENENAAQLKALTIAYINNNNEAVMDTPEFKRMFLSHPQLIANLALERLLTMKKNDDSDISSFIDIDEKVTKLRNA